MAAQTTPTPPLTQRTLGADRQHEPAIQVICLGSGGGPSEDNVTGFLVRSVAPGWVRNSVLAVDAGSHLAAITRIFEKHLPSISKDQGRDDSDGNVYRRAQSPLPAESSPPSSPAAQLPPPRLEPMVLESGPFAGLPLPHASARANAAHLVRAHVATYLISHPHLDHLAGFAINTAAFHATLKPKTLAALPFTVDAIKKHIFNDVIWPNLTDEDGGVGFVTFQRLKEGGDVMVGDGDSRGYIEVCEGLIAKGFKISHGKCMRGPATDSQRGSMGSITDNGQGYPATPRFGESRSHSLNHGHLPGTPGSLHTGLANPTSNPFQDPNAVAVDSTAYFIRDITATREVLMFGDVEPDAISIAPRLARVWGEAAPKIASGILTGIFIECSYPDSQNDAVLFGHLAPRHLIAELHTLADMVKDEKAHRASARALRKRKRLNGSMGSLIREDYLDKKRTRSLVEKDLRRSSLPDGPLDKSRSTPRSSVPAEIPGEESESLRHRSTALEVDTDMESVSVYVSQEPPLKGVRVMIMHVKDTMTDGPHVSELILQQLNDHAQQMAQRSVELGCEFVICECGTDYWF